MSSISSLRRSWRLIFGDFEVLDSTTKPLNMSSQLLLSEEIDMIIVFTTHIHLTKESCNSLYNWDFSIFIDVFPKTLRNFFVSKKYFLDKIFFRNYFSGCQIQWTRKREGSSGRPRRPAAPDLLTRPQNAPKCSPDALALLRSITWYLEIL